MNKKKASFSDFLWKDKKHRAKNFYFVLTLFLITVTVLFGFINGKLDKMQTASSSGNNSDIQNYNLIFH